MKTPQQLIDAYLMQIITAEEMQQLSDWLESDPDHVRTFLHDSLIQEGLRHILVSDRIQNDSDLFNDKELNLPVQKEMTVKEQEAIQKSAERAFASFKDAERKYQEQLALKQYRQRQRRLFVLLSSAAALLFISVLTFIGQYYFSRPPEESSPISIQQDSIHPPIVAQVAVVSGANVHDPNLVLSPGQELRASTDLYLVQGLVGLLFTEGARVILQAPCQLKLENSNQVYLEGGMVSVRITDDADGFIVRTPLGSVVDYGTEFGVVVHKDGETEAHVFDGIVDLCIGSDPLRFDQSKRLFRHSASRIKDSGVIETIAFQPSQVFREVRDTKNFAIPGQRISLMDIVAGGNGFGTGDPDCMLDITKGTIHPVTMTSANRHVARNYGSDVAYSPYIDYFFAPDGGNGPVTVTSTGLAFSGCPDTDGTCRALIAYRGFLRDEGLGNSRIDQMVLDSVVYGSPDAPALPMHANRGITFDLDAIRSVLPGKRIEHFTSICGVSETSDPESVHQGCDFWVLLDGRPVFQRRLLSVHTEPVSIDIPCQDEDRFLTLMVTDGGNGVGYDWGLFALPALELAGRE